MYLSGRQTGRHLEQRGMQDGKLNTSFTPILVYKIDKIMSSVTVKSYRKERESEIMGNLEKGLSNAGMIVARQAKKNVLAPLPSGKQHPHYKDTNHLAASIASANDGVFRIEKTADEIAVVVGTKLPYGAHLEFGTSKMPPYPWLFPATESEKPKIIEAIKAGGGNLKEIEVVAGFWEK